MRLRGTARRAAEAPRGPGRDAGPPQAPSRPLSLRLLQTRCSDWCGQRQEYFEEESINQITRHNQQTRVEACGLFKSLGGTCGRKPKTKSPSSSTGRPTRSNCKAPSPRHIEAPAAFLRAQSLRFDTADEGSTCRQGKCAGVDDGSTQQVRYSATGDLARCRRLRKATLLVALLSSPPPTPTCLSGGHRGEHPGSLAGPARGL